MPSKLTVIGTYLSIPVTTGIPNNEISNPIDDTILLPNQFAQLHYKLKYFHLAKLLLYF